MRSLNVFHCLELYFQNLVVYLLNVYSKTGFFKINFFIFFCITGSSHNPKCPVLKHFFNKFIYFIYLFLAVLGLRCCVRAFSSCGEWGLLFLAVRGLLIAVASLVAEHGLQAHGLQQLWHLGSVAVARGLQSAGSVAVAHGPSCSVACGILPDQGSNPCPLHWQADSQPLHHQGSPETFI